MGMAAAQHIATADDPDRATPFVVDDHRRCAHGRGGSRRSCSSELRLDLIGPVAWRREAVHHDLAQVDDLQVRTNGELQRLVVGGSSKVDRNAAVRSASDSPRVQGSTLGSSEEGERAAPQGLLTRRTHRDRR